MRSLVSYSMCLFDFLLLLLLLLLVLLLLLLLLPLIITRTSRCAISCAGCFVIIPWFSPLLEPIQLHVRHPSRRKRSHSRRGICAKTSVRDDIAVFGLVAIAAAVIVMR